MSQRNEMTRIPLRQVKFFGNVSKWRRLKFERNEQHRMNCFTTNCKDEFVEWLSLNSASNPVARTIRMMRNEINALKTESQQK